MIWDSLSENPVLASDSAGDRPPNVHFNTRCLESLLLNLDASLAVRTRAHFFSWTQGLLQSLIPHKLLIGIVRSSDSTGFRFDCFSTLVPDPAALGRQLLRDVAAAPALVKMWLSNNTLPVICQAEDMKPFVNGQMRTELERIGARRFLLHGSPDANGEASSLMLFACDEAPANSNEIYLLQVLVPHMHTAWMRAQTMAVTSQDSTAPVGLKTLTTRECEVLKWVYRGKSNAETASILGVSPLTVKNHVQHILRKLNVVNRAQAVGKALDARIIGP